MCRLTSDISGSAHIPIGGLLCVIVPVWPDGVCAPCRLLRSVGAWSGRTIAQLSAD